MVQGRDKGKVFPDHLHLPSQENILVDGHNLGETEPGNCENDTFLAYYKEHQ